MNKVTFFCNNLIGDAIMQTPTTRSIKAYDPKCKIIYRVPKNSISKIIHTRNPYVDEVVFDDSPQEGDIVMDCCKAMQIGQNLHISMIEGYGAQIGLNVLNKSINYKTTTEDDSSALEIFKSTINKPFVICARHSASCTSHDSKINKPNKCFSNVYWLQMGEHLKSMGIEPVAIGSKQDLEEERFKDWPWTKLYGLPLEHIAALLKYANGCISVDTGIRFFASSLGCNFIVVSCAIPRWLIAVEPQHPNQLGIELNMPVNNIDVDYLKKLFSPLFSETKCPLE